MKQVICNSADKEFCSNCNHSMAHNHYKDPNSDEPCGNWGWCYDHNNNSYKVRCVNIESKQGQKILKNLEK